MPELPDVEVFRKYVDAKALDQEISGVTVREERLLEGVTRSALARKLRGRKLRSTERHGKYLFVESDPLWLVFHFGMTGRFFYFRDEEPDPDHNHLLIRFANDYALAFNCRRKLGSIAVTRQPREFIEKKRLGPDALGIGRSEFVERLEAKRGTIKAALMDQKAIAGIGNVYADEILFHGRIHPETPVEALGRARLDQLHGWSQRVLRTAIRKRAEPDRFPSDFVTPHRRQREACPSCGTPLKKIQVSGRPTYFCPEEQERPRAA